MTIVSCYVLGLESNFRGDELVRDLKAIGIDVQIYFGINAIQQQDYLATMIDQRASILLQKREMGLTEVACALGHQGIWQKFMDEDSEWAYVFEDDALVLEDLTKVLPALGELEDPTIIQLHRSIPEDKTVYRSIRIQLRDFYEIGKEIDLVRKLNFGSGAYGYLINRKAAAIALSASNGRKVINILDWPYLWRHKVSFWEPTRALAGHHGQSIIDIDRADLLRALSAKTIAQGSAMKRLTTFLSNAVGIPAWKFHRLGYPGRIVYFNNVIMPFKRRLISLNGKIRQKVSLSPALRGVQNSAERNN